MTGCRCMTPPPDHRDYTGRRGLGEVPLTWIGAGLETCRHCGTVWLKCFLEDDGMPRSGRWWRIPLAPGQEPTRDTALEMIRAAPRHMLGGSHFDTAGSWRAGAHGLLGI